MTGRDLDVAVRVQAGSRCSGRTAARRTRATADLQMTPNGLLQTRDGLNVLGEGGPISIPPNTGQRSARTARFRSSPTDATECGQRVGPHQAGQPADAARERSGDGLFRPRTAAGAADPTVSSSRARSKAATSTPSEMLVEHDQPGAPVRTQMKLLSTADRCAALVAGHEPERLIRPTDTNSNLPSRASGRKPSGSETGEP